VALNIGDLFGTIFLEDRLSPALTKAGSQITDFGMSAAKLGAGLSVISAAVGLLGKSVLDAGMDAVEAENLFEVSFGSMAEEAREWSKDVKAAVGTSEFALREQAATLFVIADSMGVVPEKAYEMATSLTELAGDMASFYNLPHEVAFQKIQAGISGETEPLKRLGIVVNETTVKHMGLQAGIVGVGETMSESQKVMARTMVILEQTGKAHGDLARTLDSPTNMLRAMGAVWQDLRAELGMAFMPGGKMFSYVSQME